MFIDARRKTEPPPPSVRRAMSVRALEMRYTNMALLAEGGGVLSRVL